MPSRTGEHPISPSRLGNRGSICRAQGLQQPVRPGQPAAIKVFSLLESTARGIRRWSMKSANRRTPQKAGRAARRRLRARLNAFLPSAYWPVVAQRRLPSSSLRVTNHDLVLAAADDRVRLAGWRI
jgi:hypothetical protein